MRHKYLIALALAAATLVVYWQAGGHEFVSLDDYDYLINNPRVQSGVTWESLRWALGSTYAVNWHPLTWLSHMLDCQLFGLAPRGHHLTSVLLHALNSALLFLLLARLTGARWRSAFVAALFALHPLHVESVAWVAERKDVLSGFFFLVTIFAYARYAERPSLPRYLGVLCLFALGLMAKPMLVTLPCVLLLLDYWPLRRASFAAAGSPPAGSAISPTPLPRLVAEKLPLLALSLAGSLTTLVAQKKVVAHSLPIAFRLCNALTAYAAYLLKMLWPAKLAVLYPLPSQIDTLQLAVSLLLLVAVSAAVWRLAPRFPYLAVGWLWYLGMLVPVIGLVQVGVQSMADRYTYLPLIGIFIALTWGAADLAKRWGLESKPLAVAAAAVLGALACVSFVQIGYWRNNLQLFSHALESTAGNYTAEDSVGRALADRGDLARAITHYRAALRIKADYPDAHVNLAFALFTLGRTEEAIAEYRAALAAQPDPEQAATIHNNLGIALGARGDSAAAMGEFAAALQAKPEYGDAHYNLALALTRQGRLAEAMPHYAEARRLNPLDPDIAKSIAQAEAQLRNR